MKKIINPSVKLDEANNMLDELIKIHKLLADKVDFEVKDKKLALFILLGSQISLAARALRSIEQGWVEDIAKYQRILTEARDLVHYLCETDHSEKHVQAWFSGNKIKSDRNGRKMSIKNRAAFLDTETKTIENMNSSVNTAIKALSKYLHPSYELSTATFDFKKRRFKYFGKKGEVFSKQRIKSLTRLIIYEVVFSFGICLIKVFLLNTAEHLKKMATFTRKLWPESFEK